MISNEYRIGKFKFELTERENPDNANKACVLQMPKQVLLMQPDVGCRPVDKFSVSPVLTLSKSPKTQKYHFRCVGGQFFYFSRANF